VITMPHYWQKVPGYINNKHLPLFNQMIDHIPQQCVWVEIGSWMGKSASYCAVELFNRGKQFEFHCVDTWEGSEEHSDIAAVKQGRLLQEFKTNTRPISHLIRMHHMTSQQASVFFQPESIDAIFIDGDHSYEGMKTDLEHWIPLVKGGGIVAYDDYPRDGWPGIRQAVNEYHKQHNYPNPEKLGQVIGRCGWWVKP